MTSVNGGPSVSQQANTQAVMESPSSDTFGLANPTGTIGLTAVNGTAVTAPRSDSAPALSQDIVPTWTGQHTFTALRTVISNTGGPLFQLTDGDAATNEKNWRVRNSNGTFQVGLENDLNSLTTLLLQGLRTGGALTGVELGNSTDNPTYTFLGTAQALFNGSVKIVGQCGFNNTAPIAKPSVTGSRAGNAALASLLTALASYGLITDGTSA